jgi:hypothetical protein
MTTPTLIFVRSYNLGDRLFRTGDELPPNVLEQSDIDKLIDQRRLAERKDRRSLFRLFSKFSGCAQREQLTQEELDTLALPK